MEPFLYKTPIIPSGFSFPDAYENILMRRAWPQIEPWESLADDMPLSLSYYGSMLTKFRETPLIPFAIICDESGLYNDGYVVLACFDGSDLSGNPKVRIYDYGTPKISPWENMSYPTFLAWLEAAKKESEIYQAQREELERGDD
jgi:hypothetical protein